jgi:hypothetical protein
MTLNLYLVNELKSRSSILTEKNPRSTAKCPSFVAMQEDGGEWTVVQGS